MQQTSNANYLTKNDYFPYKCKNCGDCCRFYANIRLTPLDIYKMARYLSMDIKDFISDYCKVNDEKEILPVVEFINTGDNNFCPLFKDNKCSVHAAKPATCALYPLARLTNISTGEPIYFSQPHDKSEDTENHSVQDWLEQYNLLGDEEFAGEWYDFLTKTMTTITEMGAFAAIQIGTNTMYLHALILTSMYYQYDNDEDFLTQFRNNRETLNEMFIIFSEFNGIKPTESN